MITDRVELRAIRVLGTHGALAFEQERPQPFEVDLDVELDLRGAARDDELTSTVDYGALVDDVVAVVGGQSRRLLETVAESIATAALAHRGVRSVTVALRKLRPPLNADVATAGVRITRVAQATPLVSATWPAAGESATAVAPAAGAAGPRGAARPGDRVDPEADPRPQPPPAEPPAAPA